MDWKEDRGDTVEDKLNKKLVDIKTDLDKGRYTACLSIPSGIELIGKPTIQSKANSLRARCSARGIGGRLMANKFIVTVGTIITVVLIWVIF